MIIHVHGGAYILNSNIPSWAKHLLNLTFGGNNPKIVLGEVEKEFLLNTFHCKNVQVLANSLNLDDATLFERETDTQFKFLFLGRISKEKGIEYIYQAFKILKEQDQYTPEFYLAGKGEDEEEYLLKFRELLGNNFHFKGIVSGVAKTELLKLCNIFLLPSFFEGLPISLLEVMSFGETPIVTNVGSIKYVVEHQKNGLFVAIKNSKDIANAIKLLRSKPALQENIGKAAKKTVFENFNPQDYVTQLNAIYSYE